MRGADFLGKWRKETRRLEELLLMGCGGETRCPRAGPAFIRTLSGAGAWAGCGGLGPKTGEYNQVAEEIQP